MSLSGWPSPFSEPSALNQPPPVISAIEWNNLPELRAIIEGSPQTLDTVGFDGNSLLHLSICWERYEIFEYLLSLNHFDLDMRNTDGVTPLMDAIISKNEQYAIALINKGADIFYPSFHNTLLHFAMDRHLLVVAEMLIKRGADLNAQNRNGCTPFHTLFHMKIDNNGIIEGVGMMIYYGADATIPDNDGNLPFDLAVMYDPDIVVAQENLLYYTFDSYFKYEASNELLYELLQTRSPLIFQIGEYVSGVILLQSVFISPTFFLRLDLDFLRVVIEQFPLLLRFYFYLPTISYDVPEYGYDQWELLLSGPCAPHTLHYISKLRMELVVEKMRGKKVETEAIHNTVFYLLTYGLNICEKDVECIYRNYGFCDLFTVLLHMDIQPNSPNIFPRILYDVFFDLDGFLDDPFDYSISSISELLNYYSRPKLKKLCQKMGVKMLTDKADKLPPVPLLLELARDGARKHITNAFKIQKSSHFYSLVNKLPIGGLHRKILSLEMKLYS